MAGFQGSMVTMAAQPFSWLWQPFFVRFRCLLCGALPLVAGHPVDHLSPFTDRLVRHLCPWLHRCLDSKKGAATADTHTQPDMDCKTTSDGGLKDHVKSLHGRSGA